MIDFRSIKERARRLKVELIALALAARHPATRWYAKLVIAGCVAYALTPVDLVPDAGTAWLAAVVLIAIWTVK